MCFLGPILMAFLLAISEILVVLLAKLLRYLAKKTGLCLLTYQWPDIARGLCGAKGRTPNRSRSVCRVLAQTVESAVDVTNFRPRSRPLSVIRSCHFRLVVGCSLTAPRYRNNSTENARLANMTKTARNSMFNEVEDTDTTSDPLAGSANLVLNLRSDTST